MARPQAPPVLPTLLSLLLLRLPGVAAGEVRSPPSEQVLSPQFEQVVNWPPASGANSAAAAVLVASPESVISSEPPLEEAAATCPDYSVYSYSAHLPKTGGTYNLPYQRPSPECRKFNLSEVEDTIVSMKRLVKDPDLFRLFENCFPNTLDTAITWKGLANQTEEDLYEEEAGLVLVSVSSPSLPLPPPLSSSVFFP